MNAPFSPSLVVVVALLSLATPLAFADAASDAAQGKAAANFIDCKEAYAIKYANANATVTEIATAAVEACSLQFAEMVRTLNASGIKYDWDDLRQSAVRGAIQVVIEARTRKPKPAN